MYHANRPADRGVPSFVFVRLIYERLLRALVKRLRRFAVHRLRLREPINAVSSSPGKKKRG